MKKILLIWIVVSMVCIFGWSLDVHACEHPQCVSGEVLYLSDSGFRRDGTTLFRVKLDSITGRANLEPLPDVGYGPGIIPFDQANAIAVTPDGKRLYAIDKYGIRYPTGGKLGYYDIATAEWFEIGVVKTSKSTKRIPGIVLAAFAPDRTLYVASENTDSLYRVNTWNAEAILIGKIVNSATGVTVNVSGADIAFGVDGTLYLWANTPNSNKPGKALRGLYHLTLPASIPGTVYATYLGKDPSDNHWHTGLAIRANGIGDLVASTHEDRIHILDKSNGNIVTTFDMYLDGSPYDHQYGDMSVGPLILFTYTTGYWKSHSWCNELALICGVPVDETQGKYILYYAHSKNFSMLFAQLIAAKLNTNNSSGIPIIEDAELWLCSQTGIINNDGKLNWNKCFDSETQKRTATNYSTALDDFNNSNEFK